MTTVPMRVIMYPACGGAPMGICRGRHARHLVQQNKAEWVFDGGTPEDTCYLAIRLLPCGNPRKDFPSRRLSLDEIAKAFHCETDESGPIAIGPFEGVSGGGSALGLGELLRELGPRHGLTRHELIRHWKRLGFYRRVPLS